MPKSQNLTENAPKWSDLITPYPDSSFDTSDPEVIMMIIRQLRTLERLGISIDDLGKTNPQLLEKIRSKSAYPNLEQMQNIPGTHDMNKWLQTVKDIYYEEKKNQLPRNIAVRNATQGWKVTEVNDFLNWLKYYEEGTHLKYKVAHNWYGDADVGYLLPIKPDQKEKEADVNVGGKDIDFARDATVDELSVSERKRIIEKQRNKIIGRLDSAEKLLRSQDGQIFADKEFSSLLETIYDLKKKIQMVNKRSASDKLYTDMIMREANRLTYKGFIKAANLLHSLAEDPNAPKDKKTEDVPAPTPPAPPMEGSGNVGGLPATTPGTTTPAPAAVPIKPEEQTPNGIKQFLDKLETGNTSADTLEVMDNEDDLTVEDNELVSTAQVEAGTPSPMPPIKPTEKPDENLEVNENEIDKVKPSKDFDHMVESVFSNLTISDVVAKFEDIVKFYKTREMPRQLALADMMLDSLGLAPFFPSLSEATNKALEANNYISTRLEDILSKLRGTMKTRDIDVKNEGEKVKSPEIELAKKSLKDQEEKEVARKQMRKDLENESLQSEIKETPEVELEGLENAPPPPAPPPPAPAAKPPVA